MNIVNLAVKLSGMGWVWGRVDGAKTYIAAAAMILSGLAGLYAQVQVPLLAHNAAGVLSLLRSLPQNANWQMLVGGLAAIGFRHAIAKNGASSAAAATPSPTSPAGAPSTPATPSDADGDEAAAQVIIDAKKAIESTQPPKP